MTAQTVPSNQPRTLMPPLRLMVWGSAGLLLTAGYLMAHFPGAALLSWAGIAGAAIWSTRKLLRRADSTLEPQALTATMVRAALAQTRLQLDQWIQEAPGQSRSEYDAELADIEQGLTRQTLDLQIVGTRAVGKTALKRLMQQQFDQQSAGLRQWNAITLDEWTAADFAGLDGGILPKAAQDADVVLFVVQGDLTQLEWTALQQFQAHRKRVLLVLNKQDQYLPAQAQLVLTQLRQKVQGILAAEDVLAIAAVPQAIKVRRHQPDGSFQDTLEVPQPQIQPLLNRMETVAAGEINLLVLQRAYEQTLELQKIIQTGLNQVRRERALPILERYQWIAAGVAFANPLPSLDMVATAAITGKMIQELAAIYRIPISLDRATEIAGVFAKNLIQMGLVEASSQVLSMALKGNAVTYVAGGMLQGVGAAYFTRMAGLSLIELFEVHRAAGSWTLDIALLNQIARRVFSATSRLEVLKDLGQQARRRLQPQAGETMALEAI